MDLRLLGPFEVSRDGQTLTLGAHRQSGVLAILALAANRPVSRDALAEQLWAGDPPARAIGTLQAYISNLRRVLEPDRAPRAAATVLRSTATGYQLVVPDGARDIDRFNDAATRARDALTTGDAATAAQLARAALTEWRGPALADFAHEPFAAGDIFRLEEALLQAVELRIEADLALGRHAELVAELRTLVEDHPLRERLRGQLMLSLYRNGRQAEALEVARVGRDRLADELGIDPDPALQRLESAILRQDPQLDAPSAATSSATGPSRPAVVSPVRTVGSTADTAGLVGRSQERDVLGRALEAAADGRGRVVLIGGEPGIGKTRLAESFAASVADAQVVWGRCHETAGAPPFWPWRQILRELIIDLDPSLARASLGADAAVVIEVAPELASVIGEVAPVRLPDVETARFHFFDAVVRLLSVAASQRPIVLVIEDLHWADEPSLALLRHVAGSTRSTGVLMMITYRHVAVDNPKLLATTLGALAREPVVERLLLPGLTADEATTLVTDLLGQPADDTLVATVLDRTGGNPLFIIHLAAVLRAAVDAGDESDRQALLAAVPPAIIDLIGMRVAAQPETTRRLLEVAAVVGRDFDLSLLAQVSDVEVAAIVHAIEPAIAAGLVAEGDAAGTLRFTHALMREALVAGLGRNRTGQLHGHIGDALATRDDPQMLPALAHHYWEAAGVGWAEAALSTATAAAGTAMASLATEEAQRHLDRALLLLDGQPAGRAKDRAELGVRLQLAALLMRTRGYGVDEVGAACRRAGQLAAAVEAPAEQLIASWGLGGHHLVRGEQRAALTIGKQLLAAAEASSGPVAALAGHQVAGVACFELGAAAAAVRHLEEALTIARALPVEVLARFPQNIEVAALIFLAWGRWACGEDAEAEALRREALALAGRHGGYDEVFALTGSAQLGVLQRAPERVLADTDQMLSRCGEAGFRHAAAHGRIMRGWALAHGADPEAGIVLLEEGVAYFAHQERSTRLVHNLTLRAEALGLAGRADEAEAAWAAAVAALEATEERFYAPETWLVGCRLRPDDPRVSDWQAAATAEAEASGAIALRDRAEAFDARPRSAPQP
jgi:DNA-binding SARP family transcriptional activator